MKVCPYCNAINEEKNAIKCAVCGQSIASEDEYTIEDLTDESVKQYLTLKQSKQRTKKILKILIPLIVAVIGIIIALVSYNLTKPKGHIIIRESLYIMNVGDRIEISPEYYGDITAEDLKLMIKIKSTGDSVPFRYEIINNKFYIDAYIPDEITIIFVPNDDGMQEFYNNEVKIIIMTVEHGDLNE